MTKTSAFCLLITLIACSRAFSINRHFFKSVSDETPKMWTSNGRADMPCAVVIPDVYKAFQFYSLQSGKVVSSTEIASYPGAKEGKATLFWNMCTVVDLDTECQGDNLPKSRKVSYGYVKYQSAENDQTVCLPIYRIENENSFDFSVTTIEDGNAYKVQNVVMKTRLGSQKDPKIGFQTSFDLKCGDKSTPSAVVDQSGNLTLSFAAPEACGHNVSKFILLFNRSYIMPIIFLIVSLPLVFYGLKFLKKSLAVVGFFVGALMTAYVTTLFSNFMAWETTSWVVFSLATLAVASLMAYLCYNSPTLAIIAGGAGLGYAVSQQLFMVYSSSTGEDVADIYQGAVIALLMLLGIIIGWKLKKVCIILATSLTGSYLFTFGLGSLLKNYPDVNLIENQLKNKDFQSVSSLAWIYLTVTLVLFISGAVHQFHKYGKKEEDTDAYNNQGDYQKTDDISGYY